ncbi:2-hydroxyacyl-CoA dehydratase [Luteibacter yeojuensis]|uniref:2-hydroxyacyl-CoA dehydratase n=1 Tax=Luteibacter yeojuensis TaxID=345309 RepID=A0A7X5QSX7_9GAMM|nr:2-hydroxyacyl-CoA dehydratase [Luteibacter yeojuensis]NID14830.1 2-hydroxyacyl-CoA dehydratase [Luteibacter yeojuensis]
MNSSGKYDFRQFQEELAALDRKVDESKPAAKEVPTPAPVPAVPKRRGRPPKVDPLAGAKAEFEALRVRHGLTVADVVSWFPAEEGIAYLQGLIAASEPKPRRRRKTDAATDESAPE